MGQEAAEKQKRIQSLFDEGKSHDEIAKALGYTNMKSYYRYIYTHDFKYNKQYTKKPLPVVKKPQAEDKLETVEVDVKPDKKPVSRNNTSREESVRSLFSMGMDSIEVAKRKHFKDTQDMGDYMKSKGYTWNRLESNYIFVPKEMDVALEAHPPSIDYVKEEKDDMNVTELHKITHKNVDSECTCKRLERYEDILSFIERNEGILKEIINQRSNTSSFPRYKIQGTTITKSFKINENAANMLNFFCEKSNLSQKDGLELLIVEALIKYEGYEFVKNYLIN